jgi:tetratricopeptide (TPR) repeat protein
VSTVSPRELEQQYYTAKTIRSLYPVVRDDHLRYLEKWGLLRSVVRSEGETYYGFADLAVIRQAASDLQQHVPFRATLRTLAAQQAGQLSLGFEASGGEPADVVRLVTVSRTRPVSAVRSEVHSAPSAAERLFEQGERLDTGDPASAEPAMAAYRNALALDPALVPAMINLGNLHYARDELAEAQAFYVQAAVVDPACFEAHFNLGNIHHDLGRYSLAVACYDEALRLDPGYADAHFYIAVTFEKMGRSKEARAHWREYRRLAPQGEWADLAREFSE